MQNYTLRLQGVCCIMLMAAILCPPTSAQITGSGTTNYLTRFSGSTAVGNSVIYESNGLIGVGMTPTSPFCVNSGADNTPMALYSTDPTAVISLFDDTTTGYGMALVRTGDNLELRTQDLARLTILPTGQVGIGTTAPDEMLTIRGNLLIERSDGSDVLELGEGLDYAEGFDITGSEKPEPGSVVVIDSRNPGQLTVSTKPYDTTVAGIVAGAKNLGSGVRLGVNQFDCDVALAGRVYCNVDATESGIQPGDLLTTSSTGGYAMKATNRMRTAGAVLGKAMQSLEKGRKGQILVLVTLQ